MIPAGWTVDILNDRLSPHNINYRTLNPSTCHALVDRMTDEDQRALAVKTVAAVFLCVACVSVMLRCYVRGWVVKAFGWDDGSMVVAMVSQSFDEYTEKTN